MTWDGLERRDVNWREITDHMAETNVKLSTLIDSVGNQTVRIGRLENWRWFLMGCCAILTVLLNIIFKN